MPDTQNPRAFPSVAIDDRFGGMDLLSYFAGQALVTAAGYGSENLETWGPTNFAGHAYDIAEAMLAERAKRLTSTDGDLTTCAKALHDAGHLATADFHRIVNRIRAAENVREGAGE